MDTKAPLDLQAIYAPIQVEMRELAQFLNDEFRSPETFLLDLLEHIARFRGKQIRPALLFLTSKLAGGATTENHVKIAGVIELIHTATLVHDDILDDARLRRKVETLHRRWGERAAVLMGDYIYSRAFHLSTQVPGMASVLSDTTHTICEGELLQIGYRFQEIDEPTYLEIIRKKTAILYAVSCEIGGILAGVEGPTCRKLHEFGMQLGMAFQIVDDCLDYTGQESIAGKSLGTDLRQGKMTLPLIYLTDCLPEEKRRSLREALSRPMSRDTEAGIARLVREHGVAGDAFARAEAFIQSAKAMLPEIEGVDPALDVRESLDLVADYIIRRQH